jgi:hypothetical protein
MLQLIMLVVGVYYLIKLLTLGSEGQKFGMPPEVLFQWRAQKQRQYIWGIVAGWGSLVVGFAFILVMDPCYTGRCTTAEATNALLVVLGLTAVVLIGGIVLSMRARSKATQLQTRPAFAAQMPNAYGSMPGGFVQPGGYPAAPAPGPVDPSAPTDPSANQP